MEFRETLKKDWVLAAMKELNNDDPLAKLSHRGGEFTILPYYDAEDLPFPRQRTQVVPGDQWVNAPKVIVDDAAVANAEALRHLKAGVDGILFEIRTASTRPETLLDGIHLEFCSTFFGGDVTTHFLEQFATYSGRKFDSKKIKGAAYGLTIHDYAHVRPQFASFIQFNSLGIEESSSCFDTNALAQLFLEIQARLSTHATESSITPVAIIINLSDDFFGEIIRIRAVKLIWSALCRAYKQEAPLTIHCHSKPFEEPAFSPHGSMIAAASRSVSAIIGGAHVLTVDPERQDSLETRIARSISFVLQEEAHLTRAGNPSDGSYFVDTMAYELADKTWKLFKAGV